MKCFQQRAQSYGPYQFEVHSNSADFKGREWDRVIILLHGYSENGFKIYKRLGLKLDQGHQGKALVIAPNAPFPLLKNFPLDGEHPLTKEELIQGYAWYFYHASTAEFLIDYNVPAQMLAHYIGQLVTELKIPFQIIGYSQGGYLAPFLAQELTKLSLHPELVVGINCSFREDLLKELPSYPLHQLQGRDDTIIETALAQERFEKLKRRGLKKGDFHWFEGIDHYLRSEIAMGCVKISTSPQWPLS